MNFNVAKKYTICVSDKLTTPPGGLVHRELSCAACETLDDDEMDELFGGLFD